MMIEKKRGGSHSVNLHGGAMAATCIFPSGTRLFFFLASPTHTQKLQKCKSAEAAVLLRGEGKEKEKKRHPIALTAAGSLAGLTIYLFLR